MGFVGLQDSKVWRFEPFGSRFRLEAFEPYLVQLTATKAARTEPAVISDGSYFGFQWVYGGKGLKNQRRASRTRRGRLFGGS